MINGAFGHKNEPVTATPINSPEFANSPPMRKLLIDMIPKSDAEVINNYVDKVDPSIFYPTIRKNNEDFKRLLISDEPIWFFFFFSTGYY